MKDYISVPNCTFRKDHGLDQWTRVFSPDVGIDNYYVQSFRQTPFSYFHLFFASVLDIVNTLATCSSVMLGAFNFRLL